MALSNCEICRNLKLEQDDVVGTLQHRICPTQPVYIRLFNLIDINSEPAKQFIQNCPSFDRYVEFEAWIEAVDQAIAQQNDGKRLCDLFPPLLSRRTIIFRSYFEEISQDNPPETAAFLIVGDCLNVDAG